MEDSLRKYFRKRIWRRRFYETALNKKGEQSLDLSCWSLDELNEFIKDNKTIIEDYEAEEEKNSNEILIIIIPMWYLVSKNIVKKTKKKKI